MGGELRACALERAPRLEELGDVDGVEVEQDVHGLAEVACDGIGVGAVDERAAAAAGHSRDKPDVDERSQRLADGGAADLKPAGLLGLGGEPVPGRSWPAAIACTIESRTWSTGRMTGVGLKASTAALSPSDTVIRQFYGRKQRLIFSDARPKR